MTETFEAITFSDIKMGDTIQMKQAHRSRFSKRVKIAKAWDHDVVGRVYEGLYRNDRVIIESMDSRNEFRRIVTK